MRRGLWRWAGFGVGALAIVEIGQHVSLGGTVLLAMAGLWLMTAMTPESS